MISEEQPLDAAIRGLARGRGPAQVIDTAHPGAWTALDEGIRVAIGYGETQRPARPWPSTSRLAAAVRAALR